MSYVIVLLIGFGIGIVAGAWMDNNDILYWCPRCNRQGGQKPVRNAITENKEHFSRLAKRMESARAEVTVKIHREEPFYSIGTWDVILQAFTPHYEVPAFNLTRAELVKSIRLLRGHGYLVDRTGNTASGHDNNDTNVIIERTDGMSEAKILKSWGRK